MKLPLPLVALALLPASIFGAEQWKLTVEAGEFDRRDVFVSFPAPAGLLGDLKLLGDGATIPLQIDQGGNGAFVEPQLGRRAKKTYTIALAADVPAHVVAKKEGDRLALTAAGKPLFDYQMEAGSAPAGVPEHFRHGAHLHPIYTPAGRIVTGNHPPDHRWHRGVWMAWTHTDFEGRHPDFWNMGKDNNGTITAEVRFGSLDRHWSGPVQGGFVSRHRFIDRTSGADKDALSETWAVTATTLPKANVIDLVSTQTTAGAIPLGLPKYHYGGLGVRGHASWDPVDKVTMLTSNGDDRKKGDSTKAKWVHMGGDVDGEPAGLAVLIHPDNFRFPQPLRLNPKNPQLCIAPSQDGEWTIEPGKPYVSRYRLIATDGPVDKEALERAWNDYASPPKVTVTRE